LMLKPVQVASFAHLSEHCCCEDDEIVSFAVSIAHLISPFFVFLNPRYDITVIEFSRDVTGVMDASSSSGRNIWISFTFMLILFFGPINSHNGIRSLVEKIQIENHF